MVQAVVRCDLVPLLGLMGTQMLLRQTVSLQRAILVGSLSLIGSVALSVTVDSFFWRRWLWPEGAVLWFNTADNRCQTCCAWNESSEKSLFLVIRRSYTSAKPNLLVYSILASQIVLPNSPQIILQ